MNNEMPSRATLQRRFSGYDIDAVERAFQSAIDEGSRNQAEKGENYSQVPREKSWDEPILRCSTDTYHFDCRWKFMP